MSVAHRPRPAEPAPTGGPHRVVGAVAVLGLAAVVTSAALMSEAPHPLAILGGVVAIALGELSVVHIRHGEDGHSFTWSEAALVAGLVLLPHWWLPVVGGAVVGGAHIARRRPAIKVVFNAASYAVGALAATVTHLALVEWFTSLPEPAGLGLASLVFYAWNTTTVALVIARSRGVPLGQTVWPGLGLATLVAVVNVSIAILIATTAADEPLVLLTLPPVLAQLLFAYRNTREVLRERDLWASIHDVSIELQRAGAGEVAVLAVSAAETLVGADVTELLLVEGADAVVHARGDGTTDTRAGRLETLDDGTWERMSSEPGTCWIRPSTASPEQRLWLDQHGITSALALPLEWSGALVGVLRVGFAARRRGISRAESVLSTLAIQIASATATHRQHATLVHQAAHDQLTGLPNRTLLVEELDRRLARPRGGLAVLFFDLDGFKVINDSLGHHVGDDVLLEASRRVCRAARATDLVARFGGDEFVVVCDGLRSVAEAERIAQGLIDELGAPTGEWGDHLSASVGLAFTAEPGTTAESLIRDADAAMYQAKRTTPGSCCTFNADLRAQVVERLHLETDLRSALHQGHIGAHYQPVVGADGTVRGLEALARWEHAERGPISPGAFIPVAEQSGLIRRLGEHVLHRACADMRSFIGRGLLDDGQRVAVNLAAQQLDRSLPGIVSDALARNGLPATALALEVTESALVDDPDAIAALERLRAIGVTVSLDDFGTGYSSLSALRDLPVDTVKIDRSFIARLGEDHQVDALVKGIIDLAHALELQVVAEGVEGERQSWILTGFGCDLQQGWLHGHPVHAGALRSVLGAPTRLRLVRGESRSRGA